ncbi:MAG: hypothetical protein ACE5K0_12135 [Candidatus Methanofastidiosia archaeon]
MILFDETHDEFLTITGEKKRRGMFFWRRFLKNFEIEPLTSKHDFLEKLRKCNVLILAEPHSYFRSLEILELINFVKSGGNLILIGNHHNVKRYFAYGCNEVLNQLSTSFGVRFNYDEVYFQRENAVDRFKHEIFKGIEKIQYFRGCSLSVIKFGKRTLAKPVAFVRKGESEFYRRNSVVACIFEDKGRIFAIGDSSVWADPKDELYLKDNFELCKNVLNWMLR